MDRSTESDEGLTLVEIVVAMFMLSIVLMAMLPLLITGVKASFENTTNATANQFVSEQLQLAVGRGPNCTTVQALAGSTTQVDRRGISMTIATTVSGSCPAAGASGTITVSTTATRVDTGRVLAAASTLVFVETP